MAKQQVGKVKWRKSFLKILFSIMHPS